MPLFDWHCADCGHAFERLVRSADERPPCPHCGSGSCTRELAAPAAPGRSGALRQAARTQARRAGHFSNFGGPRGPGNSGPLG
ncbi:MAG: zinc ribbon domain-containing protein [Rubrivivax sp.]